VFIGIDGGGSKTGAVLIDGDGRIRATHVSGGAYYLSIGIDALRALICECVGELLGKANTATSSVQFAFFGLPAYGEDRVATAAMDQLPSACLPLDTYICGNDAVCGWAGSLACRDGINVVAGTGSICYGERGNATARCGGWGEMFSDEGSAYWIATRGLDLFARMSDGRLRKGPLHSLVTARLALEADLELCGRVYVTLAGDRSRIAQLCPLVFEAAAAGDLSADAVITQAADELTALVTTVRDRLGFATHEPVDVSCSGGVFNSTQVNLRARLQTSLGRHGAFHWCEPAFNPAIGAALYAARRRGAPLTTTALDRLRVGAAEIAGEFP
jgi:N-acetylglucosamine kinase-like BadF-type ATPase